MEAYYTLSPSARFLYLDHLENTFPTPLQPLVMPPPVINPAGPFCENDPSVTLTANPGGGTWSGTGIVNAATGEFDPATAGPGMHTITYTHPVDGAATIDIEVHPSPVIVNIAGDGLNCNGDADGNTIVEALGGTPIGGVNPYIYDWDWDQTPGNDVYPCSSPGCTGDEKDLSGLSAGTYFVTVTDANGCTADSFAIVTEPINAMTATATDFFLDCFGDSDGMIDLTVLNGFPFPPANTFHFDWDYNGLGDTNDPEDPTGLPAGVYSVTVTDFLGCTATATAEIFEPAELIVDATSDDVDCFGGSSGEIDLTVTGGTPGYLFDWDYDGTGDNDDPEDPTGLPAGTHSVTVTDANGCTATATVDVMEPLSPVTASVTATDVTCFGEMDGIIDLTPGGGTGSYSFDWDNDGTGDNDDSEDLTGVDPGSYSVTVTDVNGCTAVASVTINEPPELTGTLDTTICTGGSININGTIYDASNSNGTEVFTASNGCDSTVSINVGFDPPFTGTETYQGCEGDGYSVVVNGTTYNESNPSGVETVTTPDGCDSIVTVTLTFLSNVTGTETYNGCEGDGYSVVVNGTTYDEGNPSGMETLTAANGCDSIVTVDLTFNSETTSTISNTGCQGDGYSIVVNGTTYDESNPSGTETITNAAGCDSIITIDLSFGSPSTGSETYNGCSGDGYSVVVNGTTYNESNPGGTEVLTNAAGCDSTVTINLTFNATSTGTETYSGCTGDGYSVVVNGTTYNESIPSGTEVLTNAAGCDSIVTINLVFQNMVTGNETYSGCTGDGYSVVVNGTLYDETNPTGTETLTSAAGCDSIVTVDLTFNDPTTFDLNYSGCVSDGYSVIVNGTIYNEGNPTGTETITNAAGCDSIVNINLTFENVSTGTESYTGCQGDGYIVIVNGNVYSESNPSGTEVLTNAAGCDSVVTVNLVFNANTTGNETYNGCQGDGYSVTVNGTVYDESNPAGTEVLTNAAGCDSTVTVSLNFQQPPNGNETYSGCEGDGYSVVVGGTLYDEFNPTGTEILTSANGCDSIVDINLTFNEHTTFDLNYNGCIGDGYIVIVNNIIYSEGNPVGVEVIPNAAGCDSTVNINLTFNENTTGEETYSGCQGDGYSVVVNGTTYDESNPAGTETLTNTIGCDSIVTVDLTFSPPTSADIIHNGCEGDGYSIIVNGTVYDETNTDGVEIFPNATDCDSIVTIDLNFTSEINILLDPELCQGGSIVVNGTVYDIDNPTGVESFVAQGGCDSIVTIDLSFAPILEGFENYEGCEGDGYFVVVNGQIYDELNPDGVEVFSTPDGCDTMVTVDLDFVAAFTSDLDTLICSGGSIDIGGVIFDEDMPTGEVTLQSVNGCDSIVTVTVSFLPAPEGFEIYQGCEGDGYSVIVNGQIYDELNPTGTEEFSTPDGCDTIVHIELEFLEPTNGELNYSGCTGDGYEVTVNGVTYNESNPAGVEHLSAMNQYGCDSIVMIDLIFNDTISTFIDHQACSGDGYSVTVNGTVYNENNPSGVETMQTPTGCDSIVYINLSFENSIMDTIAQELCTGDSIIVNGTVYNESNPSGEELFTAQGGCDSIVVIDLTFVQQTESEVTYTGCLGDGYEVIVNGIAYNESNQDGVEIMSGAAGCDSVITISLVFNQTSSGNFSYTGCQGDGYEVVVNGTTYNESNPTGTETLTGGNGCDSIVLISLNFEDCCTSVEYAFNKSICEGNTYNFHGEILITNGTYYDTIPDAVGEGCDSVYILQLTVSDVVTEDIDENICEGESVLFGGIEYTSTGIYADTFPGGAAHGCDSIAILELTIHPLPVAEAGENKLITCAMSSVSLSATVQGGSVRWTGPGITTTNDTLINPVVNKPGTYTLMVTSSQGCVATDQVTVTADTNIPVVDAGGNGMINCVQGNFELQGEATGNNLLITWTGPGIHAGNAGDLTPLVDLPGVYVIIATDTASQCQSAPDTVIVVDVTSDVEAVIQSPDVIDCNNPQVLLDASQSSNGDNIVSQWEDHDGVVLSGNSFLEVSQSGLYYYIVIDTLGQCMAADSVEVIQSDNYPGVDAGPPQQLDCINLETELTGEGHGTGLNIAYIWNGPAGGILSDPDQLLITVNEPGWYVLTAIDTTNGCLSTDSVFVSDGTELPIANAGDDQFINCNQTSVVLDAFQSTTGTGIVHIWNGPSIVSDTSLTIETTDEGIYYLTVLNTLTGCKAMDSVFIEADEFPVGADVQVEDAGCEGSATGMISVSSVEGGVEPFNYSLGGIIYQDDPVFTDLAAGSYTVIVVDANDCEWSTDVEIMDGINADIEIGSNIELELGDTIQLHSIINVPLSMVDSVVWAPAHLLSCTHCLDPILKGLESAAITATVYTRGGCEDTDLILLRVTQSSEAYVPNIFSPNGDGVNDYVTVFTDPIVREITEFEVFDRWGEKVFSRNNFEPNQPALGWDGRFGPNILNPDVFVYKARLTLIDGSVKILSGDITLVR